ncbi:MAG TPA: glucose-1-phosphate adenylyltransferase [Bacillus sp. (in: firmicutes)]|uniref:glucose-1-phosphate adenylyltransferase n=1 Tax=Bacillus litorisediminis TaxID=2922713 RepID=UPI001FAC241F|nr:glucose-1-phosphate adenylyltransferase [Bacillus litorisediminis]HWO74288.1 glucose-1-phosphate adenylyltransferase [Bacillus sp. (in: firmicutes)]
MQAIKKCVAMLLAGGQGTRLGELTKGLAKPAVPFGGKYRIIDFALSNCSNSGIRSVGVLTQYQPHLLNGYVGNGATWDLDRKFGGVDVLPPYKGYDGGQWYLGTANAVFQNIHYIEQKNPEYVLVISGDHIYKMDYNRLLQFHLEKGADATIAVIEVPWQEASRFGILTTNEDNRITEFNEKPAHPKSNLASMGIYIFNWKLLKRYLIADERDPLSSHDFGKDVIPKMLTDQINLFAYKFRGYWKDVGTVQSLWEAHMDLLEENPELDLYDMDWKIYSVNANLPPHYIAPGAEIKQSLINEGCRIHGRVLRSVLSQNVTVGSDTWIKDSVIMPDVTIGNNVMIERAIIAGGTVIEDGVRIGSANPNDEIILIGENQRISNNIQKKAL